LILVDTNVWSELLKPVQNETVLCWLRENSESLVLSSIVLGELRFFVAKQDDGRRKDDMRNVLAAIETRIDKRFVGFGDQDAAAYGDLMARMRRTGTPLPVIDGWIAAQAIANGFPVSTRNVDDFARSGVQVINPWEA
jgi:predicted nucleic acid-binding protein